MLSEQLSRRGPRGTGSLFSALIVENVKAEKPSTTKSSLQHNFAGRGFQHKARNRSNSVNPAAHKMVCPLK